MYKVIKKDDHWVIIKNNIDILTISRVLRYDKEVACAVATILNKNNDVILNLEV